ncbi:MAG TPA: ABC transporter ATP-binding protein [Clostridiales bacterium]|nr:ABC transporter ATP-binding protein [Clostridiales bacterium]
MIKILTRHLGEYKKSAFIAPMFVLVETIIMLILPTLMSDIVDVGIKNSNIPYILKCGGIMVLLSLIGAVAGILSARNSSLAAQGFGSNLRVSLYNHIQDFSFADVDKFSTASLITRTTSDVRILQTSLQMSLRVLLQAPFQLIVALIIVIGYSFKLSIIYLFAVPILFFVITLLMRSAHHLFMANQQKLDNLNATIQENLIAIRVVKSFVRANYERQKFKNANDELTRANIRAISRIILMNPTSTLILNMVTLLIYWFGGKMVGNGEFLSGELLAIITYLQQIMMSVMMFSFILMQYTRAQACVTRINEVLETVPDIQDSEHAEPAAPETDLFQGSSVEFENVSFKYSLTGSGEEVLKNLSFKVEPGEIVAIIGGTGSGKSSLVNLIPRFYDVTQGRVLVNGIDVRDYKITDLRRKIGMVLQKNVLFSGSIRDNIRWGKEDATDEEIIQALKSAQAYDFVMSFPDGLDTQLHQGGTNVSGGQRQRLCIARAILKKPSILILDDSTSAVDSDTESRIRESFRRELKGCTVFIIAQRISSVMEADKIILLDEGEIESIGTHRDLIERSPIYQEIYTSQQEGVLGNA